MLMTGEQATDLINCIIQRERDADAALNHQLGVHFAELARFSSLKQAEMSPLYRRLRPEIERVLQSVECGEFGRRFEESSVARTHHMASSIKATAWNLERGLRLSGIIDVLKHDPALSGSDVLLLTELDYGMARTDNRPVARDIAEALGLNYAFAPCYLALNKGSGLESEVEGENTQALHGNALMSPHQLRRVHTITLPNGKDKMKGKEKRLGSQRAVVADVEHSHTPFRAVSLHLDAHSSQQHRHRQMRIVLDHLEKLRPSLPVLIGGDWNTSTYNSRRAFYSIAGYVRRVAMGVGNVIKNHYPHPDRWFERKLFRELERRGYGYRELNETGIGTLHYDINDIAVYRNMSEWVPEWCFWFIQWALKNNGGRCSLKLDWFAGRGINPDLQRPPRVVPHLRGAHTMLSDHDPIILHFNVGGGSMSGEKE